jgi:hypothetical protein
MHAADTKKGRSSDAYYKRKRWQGKKSPPH